MVFVAEAIVDEWTVMVIEFHATVADCAVERGLGLDDLAVGAKVV